MKKVLAIAPYPYLPYFSGGQKFIAEFLHYLGKETDLTVISVPGNDYSLAGNYKTISLLKPSFARYYDFSLVKKITALVKKEGFDSIIWEHPYYAWLAFRVRKGTGVRTLFHTHNIEYQRFRSTGRWWWPALKWYERNCFRKADGLLFITPEDREFAVSNWKIPVTKCFEIPFGIESDHYPDDRLSSREVVSRRHNIQENEKILLFSGLLNYKPNLDALRVILEMINPLLLARTGFRYKLFICGKSLPDDMNQLKAYSSRNIIYTGFVKDIDVYNKAADVFINPVQSGGGIKTKMVEAIANGTTVVSTRSGATGIDKAVCGDKLIIVNDNDWDGFAEQILTVVNGEQKITPGAYYQKYHWENIIEGAVRSFI